MKRHKAAIEAKKGKIFRDLSKDTSIAVPDSGEEPNSNARFCIIIHKEKEVNVPSDNIEKVIHAIQNGTGELLAKSVD